MQLGGDQRAHVGAVRVEERHEHGLAAVGGEVHGLAQVVVQGRQRRRLAGGLQQQAVEAARCGRSWSPPGSCCLLLEPVATSTAAPADQQHDDGDRQVAEQRAPRAAGPAGVAGGRARHPTNRAGGCRRAPRCSSGPSLAEEPRRRRSPLRGRGRASDRRHRPLAGRALALLTASRATAPVSRPRMPTTSAAIPSAWEAPPEDWLEVVAVVAGSPTLSVAPPAGPPRRRPLPARRRPWPSR